MRVSLEQLATLVERGDLDHFDAEALHDRPRILVHDASGRAGQLDAVPVHDERHRRAVQAGADESVQRLPGNPAGVAAVADDEGIIAVAGAQSERPARGDRHRDAETARADRRAAGHPEHVSGDVEAAAELFDDALARQEAERRERRVIADAGVAVLDRELRAAVIDRAERHQQRADQLEAAAEMIDVVDLGERDQRLDRDPRGRLLERRERALGIVGKRRRLEVDRKRQHL